MKYSYFSLDLILALTFAVLAGIFLFVFSPMILKIILTVVIGVIGILSTWYFFQRAYEIYQDNKHLKGT